MSGATILESKKILIWPTLAGTQTNLIIMFSLQYTDPRITKLQSEVHSQCAPRWGSKQPILPNWRRKLLEEQWPTLQWGRDLWCHQVQWDDPEPQHQRLVQPGQPRCVPPLPHLPEWNPGPPQRHNPVPLCRIPPALLTRECRAPWGALQLVRPLQ